MYEVAGDLGEIDILRLENMMYFWGLTFDDIERVKKSMLRCGLVLAKRPKE